ncbi:MAG: two-component system response regulator AdeR [Natronomonas sp.]|jgi:two-component system response regulator AdeR
MTSMETPDDPVVLVVEDEPDVAETYQLWLTADYEVRLAESGGKALEKIDDDVDVVLLDRMMPGISGDEVLAEIRDRGYDCPVAIVSAVDPDFDIIEMGFDDYITKPPTAAGIRETIDDLLERSERADKVREYRSLLTKRAMLEEQKSEAKRKESDAYADLQERIDTLESELETDEDRLLDDAEFIGALREFEEDEQ